MTMKYLSASIFLVVVAVAVSCDEKIEDTHKHNPINLRPAKCNSDQKFCTREYRPVCGTDLQTYATECNLCQKIDATRNNQLQVLHEGECTAMEQNAEKEHPEIKSTFDDMKKIVLP